jgi:hypothetical protein
VTELAVIASGSPSGLRAAMIVTPPGSARMPRLNASRLLPGASDAVASIEAAWRVIVIILFF